jgi:hypothetical protein
MAISSEFLSFWRRINEPARVVTQPMSHVPPQRNNPKLNQNSNFSNYKMQQNDGHMVKK